MLKLAMEKMEECTAELVVQGELHEPPLVAHHVYHLSAVSKVADELSSRVLDVVLLAEKHLELAERLLEVEDQEPGTLWDDLDIPDTLKEQEVTTGRKSLGMEDQDVGTPERQPSQVKSLESASTENGSRFKEQVTRRSQKPDSAYPHNVLVDQGPKVMMPQGHGFFKPGSVPNLGPKVPPRPDSRHEKGEAPRSVFCDRAVSESVIQRGPNKTGEARRVMSGERLEGSPDRRLNLVDLLRTKIRRSDRGREDLSGTLCNLERRI
jgi:hypothetical protein